MFTLRSVQPFLRRSFSWLSISRCFLLGLLLLWPGAAPGDSPSPKKKSKRPTIGLVLGGGGAKGFAHVGVLRELEKMRIPIDYIGGTSMGAIIAGFYASGMSPDEIEKWLESLDWWEVMNDKTPRQELDYRRKQDDQRYLFDFEIGIKNGSVAMSPGLAAGQKFNNLLQYQTMRVSDIEDFDQLPIPYRAVATDLQSGETAVLSHGNLARAMRASMAVPGAFTPVEWEGRLLVDGGIVDNVPVDVVRKMGADFIIAVDLSATAGADSQDQLESLGQIAGQTYFLMQRPKQLEILKDAQVIIGPELDGFKASQFQRVAEIIPVGEKAAQAVADQLNPHAVDEETFQKYLARQRRPMPESIPISSIKISGNHRVDERVIQGRIKSRAGQDFDHTNVGEDLMKLYGIGDFEQVLFRVNLQPDGTRELEYQTYEKSWGPTYVHLGLNLQSDFEDDSDWNILVNITRASINRLGAEWKNDLELGDNWLVFSEFYQPLNYRGFYFVAPNVKYYSDTQNLYDDKDRVAEYNVEVFQAKFDLGLALRDYAEFRTGPTWGNAKADVEVGDSGLPNVDEDIAGWATRLDVDRRDRTLFARAGYRLLVDSLAVHETMGSDRSFDKLSLEYSQNFSWGDHTIMPGFLGGTSFNRDIPEYAQFTLGGPFSFMGLADDQFRGAYLGVASLGYRYRLARLPPSLGQGLYIVSIANYGNVWDDTDDIDSDNMRTGVGVGVGADSKLGPLYLGYGQADGGYNRIYFSLGTAF